MRTIKIKGENSIHVIQVTHEPIVCYYSEKSENIIVKRNGLEIDNISPHPKRVEIILDKIMDDYLTVQSQHFPPSLIDLSQNKKQLTNSEGTQYYSTKSILAFCFLLIGGTVWLQYDPAIAQAILSNSNPDTGHLPNAEYYVTEEFAQKIMDVEIDTEKQSEKKENLYKIFNKQQKMTMEERKEYLSSPEVKKWVNLK